MMFCIALLLLTVSYRAASYPHGLSIDEIINRASSAPRSSEYGRNVITGGEPKRVHRPGTVRVDMDMLFSPEQWHDILDAKKTQQSGRRYKRKAVKSEYYRWTNNEIPYQFKIGQFWIRDKKLIIAAMREWTNYTCIKFRPAKHNERSKIVFRDGGECSSNVGQMGWPQPVTLGAGCRFHGIVVHELGHSIGMQHEHTRPDRDDFVTIQLKNAHPRNAHNFDKFPWSTVNDYDIPYDYVSIMHYGAKTFSKNNKPTILTTDRSYQTKIGNREGLSFGDIKLANLMYQCAESNKCPEMKCPGAGYVDKHCKCQCPGTPIQPCPTDGRTVDRTTSSQTTRPHTTGECRDKHRYCQTWAKRNGCRTMMRLMKISCRQTCGFCSAGSRLTARTRSITHRPTTTTSIITTPTASTRTTQTTKRLLTTIKAAPRKARICTDKKEKCWMWSAFGFCNNPRYQTYMSQHCPKSCDKCDRGSTGYCVDTTPNCPAWKRKGYCDSKFRVYMSLNCARSCGLCSYDTNKRPCRDHHQNCEWWAGRNQCRISRRYMRLNCAKACAFC